MASNRPLQGDLKVTGMDQASMYAWMANVTDLLNELQTDAGTQIALTAANKTAVNALLTAAGTTSASFAGLAAVSSVTESAAGALTNSTAITLLRS